MLCRKALFPGTFDPFTKGHYTIVQKALGIFDTVLIGIGVNDQKNTLLTPEERMEMIKRLYAGESRVEVALYRSLTTRFAEEQGAHVIVRGLRSNVDFEYERLIAEANRSLTGIETLFILTDQNLQHISSSVVRELIRFNHPPEAFLPDGTKLPERLKTQKIIWDDSYLYHSSSPLQP